MILHCAIADDEPIALEILQDYIRLVPELRLIGQCKNSAETLSLLRLQKVDLLFLDIKMPGVSGVDLLRSLQHPPAVILTTAFPEYALDGFDLNVVDYLLKPIPTNRFLRAVNKVLSKQSFAQREEEPSNDFLFAKADGGLVKVNYVDILYLEGLENYVRIYTKDRNIVCLATLKSIEDSLPSRSFLRIHRSYIANLCKVDMVRQHAFQIGCKSLPVGKSYRRVVNEVLKQYFTAT
jgi:DNA-binding LytR/AlgR family response regulator